MLTLEPKVPGPDTSRVGTRRASKGSGSQGEKTDEGVRLSELEAEGLLATRQNGINASATIRQQMQWQSQHADNTLVV